MAFGKSSSSQIAAHIVRQYRLYIFWNDIYFGDSRKWYVGNNAYVSITFSAMDILYGSVWYMGEF